MSKGIVAKLTTIKSKPFHKLMHSQIREMYSLKLLDAPAYVLLIVQIHGAAGWKWTFTVKDFCQEWGISKSTFYRAVSKLKDVGLLNWETDGNITVWHGSDIAIHSPTDETDSPTDETDSPTDETKIPSVGLETARTVASNCVEDPSYSSQIISKTTDSVGVEKSFPQEEEILSKYEERLYKCGIYREHRPDGQEGLVPNSNFAPVLKALSKVPPEQAERGIKTFLRQAQRKEYDYPYSALKDAILKGWESS